MCGPKFEKSNNFNITIFFFFDINFNKYINIIGITIYKLIKKFSNLVKD